MSNEVERQLMRKIHGELAGDDLRELERRIARDPQVEALHRRYAELWNGLELPAPARAPEGFSGRVLARARRHAASGELRWSSAPAWARVGSALALAAGLALGVSFGGGLADPELGDQEAALLSEPLSLAETYWLTLEESEGRLADGGDAGERTR